MIAIGEMVPVEVIEMHRLLGVHDADSYLRTAIRYGALPLHCVWTSQGWSALWRDDQGYRHLILGTQDEVAVYLEREHGILALVPTPFGQLVPRPTQQIMRRELRRMQQLWS